jgi:osmotically-inducible protein OsmY
MKTDIQIKKDVLDEFVWDPEVTSTDIGVIVERGIVTLTGHLTSYAEKLAAERAAQRVGGVKAVAVEIDVNLKPSNRRTDADVASSAATAINWNASIPHEKVHVKVEKGWVTLSGDVDWDYQRTAAEQAVQELRGVIGVSNLINIRPRTSPVDVKRSIEQALVRHAEREAKHLDVLVDGSRVTLRGKVHSVAERQAAQGAAWSAPGVSSVSNELVLG